MAPTKLLCRVRVAAAHTEQQPPATRTDGDQAAGRSAPLNSDRDRDRNEPLAASHPPRELRRNGWRRVFFTTGMLIS